VYLTKQLTVHSNYIGIVYQCISFSLFYNTLQSNRPKIITLLFSFSFFLTLKHKHTSGCAGLGGKEVDQTDKQLFKTRGVQGVTDERLERFLFLAMILSTPC